MRRGYLISGTVQGVGFRQFAWREGRGIGVTGWVRNLDDGRVEVLAEGSSRQLEEFARALRRGPAGSLVTDLHVTDASEEVPRLMSFDITAELPH